MRIYLSIQHCLAALALLVLTSCRGSSDGSGTSDSLGEIFDELGILDTRELDADEFVVLLEAEIQACMRRRGFDYSPEIDEVPHYIELDFHAQSGYSEADDEAVSRFVKEVEGSHQDYQNERITAALSPKEEEAWWIALDGDSEGDEGDEGCYGEAIERVHPLSPQDRTRLEDLHAEILSRVESTPEWARLESEWSQCMKAKGYDVTGGSADAFHYAMRFGGIDVLGMIDDKVTGDPDGGTVRVVLSLEESKQVLEVARAEFEFFNANKACLSEQESDRVALREEIQRVILKEMRY